MANCAAPPLGILPLTDLGAGSYLGYQGGLYAGGSNSRPSAHQAAGQLLAAQVGTIGGTKLARIPFVAIGFSLGNLIWTEFEPLVAADATLNGKVKLVNGCVATRGASQLADPGHVYWTTELPALLTAASVNAADVQVCWLLTGLLGQTEAFPDHAETLRGYITAIMQNAKVFFPNLLICLLASPTPQHYQTIPVFASEPYYFEQGFGIKWAIQDQIAGVAGTNYDPGLGAVVSPWIAWGPYVWCDGTNARSDGLTWICPDDVIGDGVHPSSTGGAKLAALMLADFKADPVIDPWFVGHHLSGAAISYVNGGTGSGGTTTMAPTFILDTAFGDMAVAVITNKYPNNGPATPAGWILGAQISGGSGAAGVDSGTVYTTIFYKTCNGAEAVTAETFNIASGNSCVGRIFTIRHGDGPAWVTPVFSVIAQNTPGTAWSVTGPAIGVRPGDFILVASAINSNLYSYSAQALTFPGVAGFVAASETERADASTQSGDDMGYVVSTHLVTAGDGTGAPTFVMTGSGSSAASPAGATIIMRIRDHVVSGPSGVGSAGGFGFFGF